jgi:hypothetical protein
MAKYVLAYRGGGMAETPEAQDAVMKAWIDWFGSLGAAVIDGGNPFGPSKLVDSSGAVSDGNAAALTGYSVLDAAGLDDATTKAKGCPVLASGGTIDVYEAIEMG